MKRHWPARFRRDQKGYTLVEMVLALALTGIIGLGVSMAITQVCTETSENSDYTTASRHAMNAIHWVGQDIQMAQTVTGVSGFPETSDLVLTWEWWDNSDYSVNYTVENGNLYRVFCEDGATVRTLIAEYVVADSASTNCTSYNGTLVFTVTTSIGQGANQVTVTRSREISARPQL